MFPLRHVPELLLFRPPLQESQTDASNAGVLHSGQSSATVWSLTIKLTIKEVCIQLPVLADNVTLLAFAATRRAAADMDRKAAAPAADAPCSNRSTSPTHSSKPAAAACDGRMLEWTDGQTDRRRTPYRNIHPAVYYASSVNE